MTTYEAWSDHGVGIVEITGHLTTDESVPLHASIRAAVDQAGTPNLVVVCSGIGRMALGPIGVIVAASNTLAERGGRVVLAGPDARIRRVLRVARVEGLESFADLESALRALGSAESYL